MAWRAAKRHDADRGCDEEWIALPTRSAPAPVRASVAKAASISRSLLAFERHECAARLRAGRCLKSRLIAVSAVGLVGLTSSADHGGRGDKLAQQLQPLCGQARPRKLTPGDVAARPIEAGDKAVLTGSPPVVKTIGIVEVAALAASAAARRRRDDHGHLAAGPDRPPSSATGRADSSAQRNSIATLWPST